MKDLVSVVAEGHCCPFSMTTWVSWYQEGKLSGLLKQEMMGHASAGPRASHLHPDRQLRQHLITYCFTGQMPNQQTPFSDTVEIVVGFSYFYYYYYYYNRFATLCPGLPR